MYVEDFKPEMVIISILQKERSLFLKTIGTEVKDVFGMGVPATML